MNPSPELVPLLKPLRLSGILDSLEARNREAIDRQLASTDFLSRLILDELARRDQKKLAGRLKRAHCRNQKTLEGFDFSRLPNRNRAGIQELATGRFVDDKVAVLIAGYCGTGKSHLAEAIGHGAVRLGHEVLFPTQRQRLATLRNAQAVGQYERRLQSLVNTPLLIIADFGLKPLRSPDEEPFHDLSAERYERAATSVTRNLDFNEWGDAFPANKLLGAATLDRLRQGAYRIILQGESYRDPRPGGEGSKNHLAKAAKNTPS